MFDEFEGEVVTDQKADGAVSMRPVYREDLGLLRAMLVADRRDLATALDDLIIVTPGYREATTGGIKIESDADGTWRAWLTPDVQVAGSRDFVLTEVRAAMAAADRSQGRANPLVGGYRVVDRRHGVDHDVPLVSEVARLTEELRRNQPLYEITRQEVERLKHVERENNRKITNLRNERDAQHEVFAGLQREFDKVSLERDQLEEENVKLSYENEWIYKAKEWLEHIDVSLGRIEKAVKPRKSLWRRIFRRNNDSSTQ